MTTLRWLIGCGWALWLLAGCGPMEADALSSPGSWAPSPSPIPAGSNTGDRYTAVGTNPFVVAAHDPFSTFAADVDTASYDLFRRDVNLGMRPVAAGVRLEDYVNNFPYAYAQPRDDAPFSISLDAAPDALARDTTLLRVGIQARAPSAQGKRPANLVFLVDTSGSMQTADKLPLVQRVMRGALEVLDADDRISIVTYAGSTAVRLGPTRVSDASRIEGVIGSFQAGGSTAGASGIMLAYSQARAGFIEGGINHVILCTDGDFNVGASSDSELLALIKRERDTGVTLTALGFGIGNLNDAMMEKVSNAGNGMYAVISSAQHADRYVSERLLSTIELVAKDVKIQVEFNPRRVYAYRLLGYENRAIEDASFRDDEVDAGEVGSGHRVTALYELVLLDASIPEPPRAPAPLDGEPVSGAREVASDDLALVKLRYKQPYEPDTSEAFEVRASLSATAGSRQLARADQDLSWAVAVAAFAEILKDSPYADLELLPQIDEVVHAQAALDPERSEFVQLFDRLLPSLRR